jgi:hypothetical protein
MQPASPPSCHLGDYSNHQGTYTPCGVLKRAPRKGILKRIPAFFPFTVGNFVQENNALSAITKFLSLAA